MVGNKVKKMNITHSIDIHATPGEVFSWLKDPERAKTWMTSVSKTEYLHRTPEMVGTTFRETVEEGGQGTDLLGVITDYLPDELIAFHLDGQFNVVDVAYRLEEAGGCTRLTQSANVRFKGFVRVMSLLMGSKFKQNIMNQSQKEFAKLKSLCEGDV